MCVHVIVFGYVFDLNRQAGATEPGHGGFEVGLGLAQEPIAEEPEIIEELPVPDELPEETPVEPEPLPQPTPVVETQAETSEEEATRFIEQLTLEVRPRTVDSTPKQATPVGRGAIPSYGGDPGVRDLYIARLAARLNRFKYYPIRSLRRGDEGVSVLVIELDRRGAVLSAEIAVSSGFDELDNAALRIVENAKPLPRFDRRMPMAQLRARIPITFEVSKRDF